MTASEPTANPVTSSDNPADARQRLEDHYRQIERTYDDTRARLEDFNHRAVDFIRENPGVCIVGAVAAGFVIGRLASRRWLV